MKTILMFAAVCFATILIVAGLVAIGRDDGSGWLYVLGGAFALILASTPGMRMRSRARRSD